MVKQHRDVRLSPVACRYAKRHVKTHKILATIMIDPAGNNPLTTGLTGPGLLALWEARQKLPKALSEAGAFKQLLHALL